MMQINDNHQDELIINTTVKQPVMLLTMSPPLFSSVGEERGGEAASVWLTNGRNIEALSLRSLREVIMKNVDNSIRVRNPEWKWPQKVTNKQTAENGSKIFTKNSKFVQGQECCREKESRHIIRSFPMMDTFNRVSDYLSFKKWFDEKQLQHEQILIIINNCLLHSSLGKRVHPMLIIPITVW